MTAVRGWPLARDAAVASGLLAVLYLLASGGVPWPLTIPGYLLIVGFDLAEVILGPATGWYPVAFVVYLGGLGLLAALVAAAIRTATGAADVAPWRIGLAAALAIVAAISLSLAAAILVTTTQWRPVAITGATGLVFLAAAAVAAGALDGG